MGPNQFYWDPKPDILKTLNDDILIHTPPPVPVSSRYQGLSKKAMWEVEKCYRVSVVVEICTFNSIFNFFLTANLKLQSSYLMRHSV